MTNKKNTTSSYNRRSKNNKKTFENNQTIEARHDNNEYEFNSFRSYRYNSLSYYGMMNVFELYKHAFFMDKGLIGEFAQDKIRGVQYAIEHHTLSREEILQTIELIGDKAIKIYFYSLLERDGAEEMLSYYEHKVLELKDNIHAADKQK